MKKDNQNTTEKFVCSVCGTALTKETMYEFEGQIFCKECFNTQTTVCSSCGRRISNYDSITFVA